MWDGFAQCTYNRSQWESYFDDRGGELDPIEGLWSVSNTVKIYDVNNVLRNTYSNSQVHTVAIYRSGGKYKSCVLSGSDAPINGDYYFENTAINGVYLMQSVYRKTNNSVKADCFLLEGKVLEFSYNKPPEQLRYEVNLLGKQYVPGSVARFEHHWIKLYPFSTKSSPSGSNSVASSGTGFALSTNGYIATNYHVIEGATNISIRGVKGDFNSAFKAEVIAVDKTNDLAILKIKDEKFNGTGTIPYTLLRPTQDVGSDVFALGYPMRASMGDEVKLTNGIISSKSGFMSDITTYQVTIPVQPGNSGGPMYNSKGSVVGIISAKHTGAENAAYAIKTSYLYNLIESMDDKINLPSSNLLVGKSLAEQVKQLKKLVYIIEVY